MDQVLINIENILHNNPAALAKKCQLSVEVLQRCLSVLRQLSPRPSSGFLINIYNDNIIPDGFVQKTVDGVFVKDLAGKQVKVIAADVKAQKGIIHVIDNVLSPEKTLFQL